jgi:UDP-glucose 4-epimerase
MSNIIITGAHGFIGRHLSHWLAQQGHQVAGLGHGGWSSAEASSWGLNHWLSGDIHMDNLRKLQQRSGKPEFVYHLAGGSSVGVAVTNPREDFLRSVVTTAELLEWVRVDFPQVRVVAISSAAVYGAGHDGSISEEASLLPHSPYGHHKKMMEELCRSYATSYGLRVSIARLFSVFGLGLKKQLLWDLCKRIASGVRPIVLDGSGNELRDWTNVRDVVRALELMANQASPSAPVLNIGTGTANSVQQIAAGIARHWQLPDVSKALQFSGRSRPGDPFSLVADATRLTKLGFFWGTPIDEGLEAYVRWFQDRTAEAR